MELGAEELLERDPEHERMDCEANHARRQEAPIGGRSGPERRDAAERQRQQEHQEHAPADQRGGDR